VLLGNGNGTFQAPVNYVAGTNPSFAVVGDFNGDSQLDLAITNFDSKTVSVLLGNGNGTFQNATSYDVGAALAIATGDFSGDGRLDLAVANYGNNNVGVLLSKPDGTFQNAVNFSSPTGPISVAVGDFNGDGRADIVTANFTSNNISILLANPGLTNTLAITKAGTGTGVVTTTPAGINCGTTCSTAFAAGQVVTLVATPTAGSTLTSWSGDPDCADGSVTMSSNRNCVATFNLLPPQTLTITKAGTGTGSITSSPEGITCGATCGFSFAASTVVTLTATPAPGSTFAGWSGDPDCSDGSVTMAAARACTASFTLLPPSNLTLTRIGTGSGTVTSGPAGINCGATCTSPFAFGLHVSLSATPAAGSVFVAWSGDPDCADGSLNMIAARSCAAQFDLLTGQTTTTTLTSVTPTTAILGVPVTLSAQVSPANAPGSVMFMDGVTVVGVANLNAFGVAQLVTTALTSGSHHLRAVYGGVSGSFKPSKSANQDYLVTSLSEAGFAPATTFAAAVEPSAIAAGDFNLDGRADLAVTNHTSNTVSILIGSGTGTFQPPVNFGVGNAPFSVATGDFNGDGLLDVAVGNQGSNNVSVLLGNGTGSFLAAVNYSAGAGASAVSVGDFNGDGRSDLAVANFDSNNVSVLLGNGNGTFQPATNYDVDTGPFSLVISDFNADGIADFAVANFTSNNVSVLIGNGNGTFQAPVNFAAGTGSIAVIAGDFNEDGKVDLAVANFTSNNVSVLLGNGNGTFQTPTSSAVGNAPNAIAVGDLNGDGHSDLAVANLNSNNETVLLGNGNGTFQTAVNNDVAGGPVSVAVADFNGDGRSDLAFAAFHSTNASVLLGIAGLTNDLTITKLGTGTGIVTSVPVRIDCGVTCAGPFNYAQVVTLTPTPAVGSMFVGWTGDSDCTDGSVTMTEAHTCTATFNLLPPNSLTITKAGVGTGKVTSVPAGLDCGPTCTSPFSAGAVVTLTATPTIGSFFIDWTGDADCTDGSVTMNATHSCTATFGLLPPKTLTINRNGTGSGTVTSNPGGVSCGATCAAPFPPGTDIDMTATPNPGSTFTGWTGDADCLDGGITMSADHNCTATFTLAPPTLTVSKVGTGTGTITSSPAGLNCGATCSAPYAFGQTVTLTATAGAGFVFNGWSGDADCSDGSVTMTTARNCIARFDIPGTTSITLGATPLSASVFGQNITLVAQVVPASAPGSVIFMDGVVVLGSGPLNSNGTAQLTTASLSAGSHSLRAIYGLNLEAGYLPSQSAPVNFLVSTLPSSGLAAPQIFNTASGPIGVTTADFNGDGKVDIATANLNDGNVSLVFGLGGGTFVPPVSFGAQNGAVALAAGDFNGDGKMDIAVANQDSSTVSILLGNGDTSFQSALNFPTGSGPSSITVGDFNRDGKADLATANFFDNNVSVLLGNGNGTFQTRVNYAVGGGPFGITVGDLNNDERADLIAVTFLDHKVNVLLGVGNGNFVANVTYPVYANPIAVAVGDFNLDGKLDVVSANNGNENVSVLLGNGDGTLQALTNYATGAGPTPCWSETLMEMESRTSELPITRVETSLF
jgi:hypothetical protein